MNFKWKTKDKALVNNFRIKKNRNKKQFNKNFKWKTKDKVLINKIVNHNHKTLLMNLINKINLLKKEF